MIDPSVAIGAGLSVLASKDILIKLFGPSADYIGAEMKGLVEKCNINLDSIFMRATKKLGPELEKQGVIAPRVLKRVWDEGRFCENELTQEYFAGLLVSSRSEKIDDDRALPFLSLIRDLSSYDLKAHYIFYTLTNQLLAGQEVNIQDGTQKEKIEIFVPAIPFLKAMGVSTLNIDKALAIVNHSVDNLARSGLIDSEYSFGTKEFLQQEVPEIPGDGFIFLPSIYGASLYLWANGAPDVPPNTLVCEHANFKVEISIEMPEGAIGVHNLKK